MMAVDLPNWDQLFPPLHQSHLFTQEQNNTIKPMTKTYSSCFTSSASGSLSSSPLESEQSSTVSSESERDEDDDYIAELTRKMAQYMLQDEDNIHENETQEEGWSAEWPNLGNKDESEKLHKDEENNTDGFLSKKLTTSNLDFQSKQALIDEQIRNIQFMKKQQRRHNEVKRQIYESKSRGSEMRAVLLGESASKGGTGVFLPRGGITNSPNNSRKKPAGCSTVLIPARVLEALQLHFDRKGTHSKHTTANFLKLNDGMLGSMRKGQEQSQPETTVPATNNKEIGLLPQEWTY
ncbi:hypothetical protein M5689_002650 [Euphorbia peplus]|nr:hypothetical protein M5689_002650 [Euphorbia peplus]